MERQRSRMSATTDGRMAGAILLREDRDGVCTLTLSRPDARNALSVSLMRELQSALDLLKNDSSIRVVVLGANGPAFCAGHDLKELRSNPNREFYEQVFTQCSTLMISITRLPKPVIAKVHGIATAAGCQLVATCDLALASTAARFATPGVNIGLFCSTPMVALSRVVGRKASMEMLLTGRMVGAEEAERIGLINSAVAPEALDAAVAELAHTISEKSSHTIAVGKEAFYRQLEMGLEEAYAYTSRVMTENMLARDAEEGIDAFLEKRPAVWKGC